MMPSRPFCSAFFLQPPIAQPLLRLNFVGYGRVEILEEFESGAFFDIRNRDSGFSATNVVIYYHLNK